MHNPPAAYQFGWVLVFGLAAASIWKLAVADRITRVLRYAAVRLLRRLQKAKVIGVIPFHIEYALGCALCAPFWIVFGLWWFAMRDGYYWAQAVVFIMAARIAGYFILRYFQETTLRDWPSPLSWPPKRGKAGGDD